MNGIWAIILAGGESRRMGFPKMLLPFDGKTMIETVIKNVSQSMVTDILVVLGSKSQEIAVVINDLPVTYCINENYKDGMLSSVKCGFKNLPSVYNAVLVFQGDQPLITSDSINTVIESWLVSEKGMAVPVYNTRRGHPLLIGWKYRQEIEGIDPVSGLNSLTKKFPDDVLEVKTSEPGILRDFDTYADYLEELNK